MRETLRRCWPAVKILLSLAILALIGWRFYKDLSAEPDLFHRPLAWHWLVPASLCYLGGLSLSALYWRRLMLHLQQPAPLGTTFRAYFVGQLGKYVPGKALALVMRAGFMRGAGTSVGFAGLTAFYEVLVTMAAGAFVALLLFVLTDPAAVLRGRGEGFAYVFRLHVPEGERIDRLTLVLFSLGLCLLLLTFIYPGVLNRLVKRVTTLFRLGAPPPLRAAWLGEGLLTTAPCWLLFGLALACALHTVPGAGFDWSLGRLAYLTAVMALAYVAGFFVPIPGAVGVREFFLYELLAGAAPEGSRAQVVLAVLLLRLAWTAAEVVLAGILYFSHRGRGSGVRGQEPGASSALLESERPQAAHEPRSAAG
jgi:glycosyltransferase 2 family protein